MIFGASFHGRKYGTALGRWQETFSQFPILLLTSSRRLGRLRHQMGSVMAHFKTTNPVRSDQIAKEILATAAEEWKIVRSKNGNVTHGFNIRYRNRLMAEAGYKYNEAYYAMVEIEAAPKWPDPL